MGVFLELNILCIDVELVVELGYFVYGVMGNFNVIIFFYDIVIVFLILEIGVSIDVKGYFYCVFCFVFGS